MRNVILIGLLFLSGCAPLDSTPRQTPKPTDIVIESTVTTAAKAAFRTRDKVFADELDAIANDVDSGELKFDAKLAQRIDQAKAKAAEAANGPFSTIIANEFGAKALDNPAKVSKSLRDLAKALR
jgi:hypothetical protein